MSGQDPVFHPAQGRFELAIGAGCLSANPAAANYAGDYMYMGTQDRIDLFKHRTTRQYLRHCCWDLLTPRRSERT